MYEDQNNQRPALGGKHSLGMNGDNELFCLGGLSGHLDVLGYPDASKD